MINTVSALVDLTEFVAEHTYTPDLDGCVSLNVRTLIMRRSVSVVVVICEEESSITSISVPLFTHSQVMSGLGTPSAVQENMAGSGDTTLTLMGGAVMEGATRAKYREYMYLFCTYMRALLRVLSQPTLKPLEIYMKMLLKQ